MALDDAQSARMHLHQRRRYLLRIRATNQYSLLAPGLAGKNDNVAATYSRDIGHPLDEDFIGTVFHGWCLQRDLEPTVMLAYDPGCLCTRLAVKEQRNPFFVRFEPAHSMQSAANADG